MFLSASASAATWAQFALGGGYDAVLMVSNKTPFPWSGTVTVYQGFNGAWAGRWYVNGIEYTRAVAYAVSLPPFGTAKLLFTGDSVLRVGYMDLDSDSSYSILDVAYSFFYNLRAGTDLLETIGGPESAWDKKIAFAVEKSAKVDTGYAWCPSSRYSTTPFLIVLTLYNANGCPY
jgi:hypothetical protein